MVFSGMMTTVVGWSIAEKVASSEIRSRLGEVVYENIEIQTLNNRINLVTH